MIYHLNLDNEPFELILLKKKVVEMRLLKPGRELITSGDYIEFKNNKNQKTIMVIVKEVKRFADFKELYDYYPKEKLGYNRRDVCSYKDMNKYYLDSDIVKYGVIGIEIELMKGEIKQ